MYRGQVADAVPAGTPANAADAARDTFAGAVGAADQLPARVLEAAADAFTQGMQVAALGSAALVVVVAGLTAASLRRNRSEGGKALRPALAAAQDG